MYVGGWVARLRIDGHPQILEQDSAWSSIDGQAASCVLGVEFDAAWVVGADEHYSGVVCQGAESMWSDIFAEHSDKVLAGLWQPQSVEATVTRNGAAYVRRSKMLAVRLTYTAIELANKDNKGAIASFWSLHKGSEIVFLAITIEEDMILHLLKNLVRRDIVVDRCYRLWLSRF